MKKFIAPDHIYITPTGIIAKFSEQTGSCLWEHRAEIRHWFNTIPQDRARFKTWEDLEIYLQYYCRDPFLRLMHWRKCYYESFFMKTPRGRRLFFQERARVDVRLTWMMNKPLHQGHQARGITCASNCMVIANSTLEQWIEIQKQERIQYQSQHKTCDNCGDRHTCPVDKCCECTARGLPYWRPGEV